MSNTQGLVHLNLDLSPELDQILEELTKKLGGSKNDVLRQAIALMQIMVIAKEQTQSLGIPEAEKLIANEIITPPKTATATHPLDNFIETFGVWEDERTSEEIIEDIYNSRTISNTDYSL
ncbi:ribbon-helix-helix domain-containing protein [Anabaena azotica]|uniref:Ribbon-helix-helix protein CopG domain-containing protein n=1 Tax=Anabaena azotica FACHB-119 TaxID=947527 RepID=A0ABR8D3Y3_9NOST|nr:hypothetical protein [Anabaena azotica]MBD2501895.1 hypothetical protein [Anabaena azotica FACHB-119]